MTDRKYSLSENTAIFIKRLFQFVQINIPAKSFHFLSLNNLQNSRDCKDEILPGNFPGPCRIHILKFPTVGFFHYILYFRSQDFAHIACWCRKIKKDQLVIFRKVFVFNGFHFFNPKFITVILC